MIINYFGEGCFRVENGSASFLVDPTTNRLKADVTLRTSAGTANGNIPVGEIIFPGEYEAGGFEVQGFQVAAESTDKLVRTVYRVEHDGTVFVFLGRIGKIPEPELMEHIGEADALCFSFDGEPSLSVEGAAKIIKQLAPHTVVIGAGKRSLELQKMFGQKGEPQEKFVFKPKDIASAVERIVILGT